MQNEESQKVVARLFEAIAFLKEKKLLRSKLAFTNRYEIDSRNFYKLEKNHSLDRFELSWFTALVEDYGVSAEWLLTGKGKILKKK